MSMPPTMQPAGKFKELLDELRDLVNASSVEYGKHDGNKFYTDPLLEAALMRADEEVAGYFLSIPNHPRRIDFMTQVTDIAHGTKLPAHIGPVGSVLVGGKKAEWRDEAAEIAIIRDNIGAGISFVVVKRFYNVTDNRIFFVSSDLNDTADVDLVNYKEMTASIQSPFEFKNAVLANALKFVFGKEAAETELAGAAHFKSINDAAMTYVTANQTVPSIDELRKEMGR